MSSKMEQIIEEIEEYVDSCKFQPLSSTFSDSPPKDRRNHAVLPSFPRESPGK